MSEQPQPIDLTQLAETISRLRAEPKEDSAGLPPREVVSLSFLERAFFEISEARAATERLGVVFGGKKI